MGSKIHREFLLVSISILLSILIGCGGRSSNSVTSSGQQMAPTASLSVSPGTITAGSSATLTWSTTNATSAMLDNGIGAVPASGSRPVSPAADTTYTLTASGPGGSAKATANLSVKAGVTVQLSANPTTITRGQQTVLTWSSTNADSVTITPDIGQPVGLSGSANVTPSASTTYVATAVGAAGTSSSAPVQVTVNVPALQGIFTYKGDLSRIGANLSETVLSPATVNSLNFGKISSHATDGVIFTQPLFVSNVPIPDHAIKNVIYVATEHDSVYALDADNLSADPLWKVSFIDPANGVTTVPACISCGRTALGPEIGVTGTPVIDPQSETLYVSAATLENSVAVQRLHALDIESGKEKFGSPKLISASVPGSGVGNDGKGNVPFDYVTENQRPGLLLLNGVVYVTWASFSDAQPYHGWVLGYDAQTLEQVAVLNLSPNSSASGIWQGGAAPAADADGNIYLMTGNGHFDVSSGGRDYGQTFLKLRFADGKLNVVDYFTPFNWQQINTNDLDIGAGGPALLPDQSDTSHKHMLVSGTKDGNIYLVDRDNMGHIHAADNSQLVQQIALSPLDATETTRARMYGTPTYWNGFVYIASANGNLKQYQLSAGQLSLFSQSSDQFGARGPIPVVSANGNTNGIVWLMERVLSTGAPILHAYDAGNVVHELYNSNQMGQRDRMAAGAEFAVPTVFNGKVYVDARNVVTAYGLLK